MEAHRRSQRKKAAEKKKSARQEILAKTPLSKRDPSKLFIEIERLREEEAVGSLDGPGRMKRSHLEQQFVALNRARGKAKLRTMSLPEFDPEEYLARRKKITSIESVESVDVINKETIENVRIDLPMPDDEPLVNGVPGLPPYRSKNESMLVSENNEKEYKSVLSGEATIISKEAHLTAQVDRFLNEIDM